MSAKTFELEAQIEAAKKNAIRRIEAVMMPGAEALCAARKKTDEYWIEREIKVDGARLYWRSQSLRDAGSPESRASVQIVLLNDETPELLARLYVLAVDNTTQIVRECAGKIADARTVAELTVAAYETIGS